MTTEDVQAAATVAIKRTSWAIFGWLGSITLADVQMIVAIVSGLAVLAYTLMNAYVLWRDKIKRKE